MSTIKAILFDLGNVIVKVDLEKLKEGFLPFCKNNKDKLIRYFAESDNMRAYQEGKINSSQFYNKTKRFFRMDMKYNEFYAAWNNIFDLYPESEKILLNIKKLYPDIKLFMFSDTNESHYNFLVKKYDVLSIFDGYVLSYKIGKHKPHSKMFREAINLSGCLPKEIFYTDDREDLISGARIAGVRAYQFTSPEDLRAQLAKFEIFV
ncbi:MAG: HAD hydrolase-like protein [Candidatus Omnitrophica bacterium]|nr:HAD hydrolase-like protein [Candidatus Omnitrophota bacterium]